MAPFGSKDRVKCDACGKMTTATQRGASRKLWVSTWSCEVTLRKCDQITIEKIVKITDFWKRRGFSVAGWD